MFTGNIRKGLSGVLAFVFTLVICVSMVAVAETVPVDSDQDTEQTGEAAATENGTEAGPSTGEEIIVKWGGEGYSADPGWQDSGLMDYDGGGTQYAYGAEEASWLPTLEAGNYEVYVWRVLHETSDPAAEYTIVHNGKETLAYADFTTGTSQWVLLGTYDFEGVEDEGLVYRDDAPDGVKRVSSAKFVPTTAEATGSVTGPPSSDTSLVIIGPGQADYAEKGSWNDSNQLLDHNGSTTRYADSDDAEASWLTKLTPGNYRISVWKNVHESSHKAQEYNIRHKGKVDKSSAIDFSTGEPGWVVLGVYDFAGSGQEGLVLSTTAQMGVKRAASVKFEATDDALTGSGTYTDLAGSGYEKTVAILSVLEILRGYDDGSFKPDNEVTRAEFAAIIARMTGLEEVWKALNTATEFEDVPTDYWAAQYISGLNELGVIKGYGENKFGPDDPVTYEQAAKIVVNMLGYGVQAEGKGGYPMGYILTASSLGLDIGITNKSGSLSRGNTACLVFNAINTKVAKRDGFGETSNYTITDGDTLLWSIFKVKRNAGIVNANPFTDIYGGNSILEDGEIEIDKVRYQDPDNSALFGHKVEFYYKEDVDSGDKTIVYMTNYGKTSSLEMDLSDITGMEGNSFTYYKEDSSKILKATIAQDAVIVYNGGIGTGFELYDLMNNSNSKGDIKCIDTDENGSYDVVLVTQYYNYVVSGINTSIGKFFDKDSKLICPELDESNTAIEYRFISYGAEVELTALSEWDVASVAVSDPDAYDESTGVLDMTKSEKITVYVSDNSVSGSISMKSQDKVFIDEIEYEVDPQGYYVSQEDLKLHVNGEFLLDYKGILAGFQRDAEKQEAKYGYLVEACLADESMHSYAMIRVFTPKGKMEELTCNETITLNEQKKIKAKDVFAALAPGGVTANQVIKYTTNSQKKVYNIETAKDYTGVTTVDPKDQFRLEENNTSMKYNGESQSFMLKYFIEPKTVVFLVPADPEEHDDYEIGSVAAFTHDENYTVDIYNVNDVRNAEVLVNHKGGNEAVGPALRWNTLMVNYMTQELDGEGNIRMALNGLQNGSEVTFSFSDESELADTRGFGYQYPVQANELKTGDIVQVNINAAGQIRGFRILIRADEYTGDENFKWKYSNASPDYSGVNFYLTSLSTLYGNVVKKSSNMLAVQTNDDRGLTYHKTTSSVQYYRYSISDGLFTKASYDDIGIESNIFIRYAAALIKDVVIIEE